MMSIALSNIQEGESTSTITGYVTYQDRPVLVQLLEVEGETLTVKACEGEPFEHPHYGTTDTLHLDKSQFKPLFEPRREPEPVHTKPALGEHVTLLDLALAAAKNQWVDGEPLTIWGKGKQQAYLVNYDGIVYLRLLDCRHACTIFVLDHHTGRWEVSKQVERNYMNWTNRLQAGR